MRNAALLAFSCIILVAATGCAQKSTAKTIDPAPFELPKMKFVEPVLPAIVAVQGRQSTAPVGLLTPSFEPEPLTPEEEAALAPAVKPYDFLAMYKPERGEKHGVSPQAGGVLIGKHGGGASFGQGPSTQSAFAMNVYEGPPADIHPQAARIAQAATWEAPHRNVGRNLDIYVGYGPVSRVASHRTHIRP